MPPPHLPSGARCRPCGYSLDGVVNPVCPECGRGFDPADPTTFDAHPRAARMRRWRGRLLILAVLAAAVYAFAPRGYVVSHITLTNTACGLNSDVRHMRLVGPPWLQLRYPRWTTVTDNGSVTLANAAASCTQSPSFQTGARKSMLRRFWLRSSGSMGAVGSPPKGFVGVVNQIDVTPANAGRFVRSLARDMAGGGGYGISVDDRPLPGAGDGSIDEEGATSELPR